MKTTLCIIAFLASFTSQPISLAKAPELPAESNLSPIAAKMVALRRCESSGDDLALHKFDGLSHSYGRYQWKIESMWYYNQKYHLLPNIEENELINVIYDPVVQDLFTFTVLQEKNGWKNWFNCSKKIGLDKV